MKLEEIFAQGHGVALTRNPVRRVVKLSGPPDKAGFWLVRMKALPGLVVKRRAEPEDLDGRLPADQAGGDWSVDFAHCWCERCNETRLLSQTDSGDL